MPTLAANSPLFYLPMRGSSSPRRLQRSQFDQVIPSEKPIFDFGASGYVLDSLSEIAGQQSLSQEQIAKSRAKEQDERISSTIKNYNVSNIDDVKKFVEKHTFLIALLAEIPERVSNFFGSVKGLDLRLISDKEFKDSSELSIRILTNLKAKDAMDILDKFDEEWWLDNISRAKNRINVSLEFV